MAAKDKDIISARLAYTIHSIFAENRKSKKFGKIVSIRGLAGAAEVNYRIVQAIAAGTKNPQFSTIVALADGFGMTVSEFTARFEKVSEEMAIKWLTEKNIKPKKKK